MRTTLAAFAALLGLACSTPGVTNHNQPVVLSNKTSVAVFYFFTGLESAHRIDPAPVLRIERSSLPELKQGKSVPLGLVETFESEKGVAVFPYYIKTAANVPALYLMTIQYVPYEKLKTGQPIVVED